MENTKLESLLNLPFDVQIKALNNKAEYLPAELIEALNILDKIGYEATKLNKFSEFVKLVNTNKILPF